MMDDLTAMTSRRVVRGGSIVALGRSHGEEVRLIPGRCCLVKEYLDC